VAGCMAAGDAAALAAGVIGLGRAAPSPVPGEPADGTVALGVTAAGDGMASGAVPDV